MVLIMVEFVMMGLFFECFFFFLFFECKNYPIVLRKERRRKGALLEGFKILNVC